jgi:hypothetical protein
MALTKLTKARRSLCNLYDLTTLTTCNDLR